MAQKDITEKLLEDYNDVFADIVDVLLFDGKQIVREEDLADAGVKSQYKADNATLHEQERDVAKFWKKGNVCIAVLGLENQTAQDKDMPLRILAYDGASYRSQILNGSGKRYPVITLVLYFGDRPWSGPKSLHECLYIPEKLKGYVNDYQIRVIDIPYLSEKQISEFQSDFRIVADYFAQRQRKNGEYTPGTQEFRHTDAILKFFNVFTDDKRFTEVAVSARKEGKEVKNMCDVLDRVEGKGRAEGRAEGRVEGRVEGGNLMVYSLVADGDLSPEKGAERLEITVEALKKKMEICGYKFPDNKC